MAKDSSPKPPTAQTKMQGWRSNPSQTLLAEEKRWSPKHTAPGPSGVSYMPCGTKRPFDAKEEEPNPSKKAKVERKTADNKGWREPEAVAGPSGLQHVARETGRGPDKRQPLQPGSSTTTTDTRSNADSSNDDIPLREEEHKLRKKYRVEGFLNKGGFGYVLKGFRIEDHFPVVFKFMELERVRFTEVELNGQKQKIPMEVYLLLRLGAGPDSTGPNITPRLLDWYNLGPHIVLVMERPMPCMDLRDYLKSKAGNTLDAVEAKSIFRQLVREAIEMEEKNVFHRDIKPSNILIEFGSGETRAKIIDFGISSMFTPGEKFTDSQCTPSFMCPEWFREHSILATPTTVWQLGLVLHIMLYNNRPLVRERTIGSMRAIPLSRSIPFDLRDLLSRCLAKDPVKRATLQEIQEHPWLALY